MLTLTHLEAGYGKKQVLNGVSLSIQSGEVVALIGPNGSGKSTTLKAICGLTPIWKGEVWFNGKLLNGLSTNQIIANKIAFSPQGNRVFNQLTVVENLAIGGHHLSPSQLKHRIEVILELFPMLRERLNHIAGKLSGGQQQILAFARMLIPSPSLLLLDEPSLGLAPGILNVVFERIVQINQMMGISILIVEQRVQEVLQICDRVYLIKQGTVAFEGGPEELLSSPQKLRELFL